MKAASQLSALIPVIRVFEVFAQKLPIVQTDVDGNFTLLVARDTPFFRFKYFATLNSYYGTQTEALATSGELKPDSIRIRTASAV